MAITVKHTKVSTVPDSADTSLVRPSDWNADHALTGLGTAAEKDVGVANGVASLDSTGKVPVSELPAAVIGALNYQGTWNASTNTPTLTSGVGTKGYYYVVNVAGTTNLDGITDWQIGDWAVYNGTAWQKVDNTDAGGDVVGPASATDNAITRFDGTTGKLIQNSVVTVSDTGAIAGATTITDLDYLDFDTTYATTLGAGQLGWNGNDTLGLGMIGGNVVQHIGEDTFFYVKASATITKGQLCMFTGAVGSSGVLTAAPATAIPFAEAIIGVAAEDIANNAFGLIQNTGTLKGVNTSAFLDGDILYYNSAVTGGFTKTYPASGPVVIAAAVAKAGSGGSGVLTIRISFQTRVTGSTGLSVVQANDTVALTNTGVTSAVAGTGISVSGATGAVTITNTAPDQTVSITGGTGISTSGTYPNFTVTNTSPSSGGTVTSVSALTLGTTGTDLSSTVANSTTTPVITLNVPTASASNRGALSSADWTTFNSKVTSVSGTTGRITSSGGTTPAIDLASGIVTAGTTGSSTAIPVITVDTYGRVTSITTASNPQGTVTSVGGTGTVNGITLSGTVTSSGNLTLGGTLSGVNLTTQVTGTLPIANGGTNATTAPNARTNLGATTVGSNLFTLTNPSAITFPRINADNTVSTLDAATFRTAIGAGTGNGTVTSVGGTGTVNGITLTGTVTSSGNLTLGGTLSGVSLSTQVTGTLPIANGGSGQTTAQAAMNAFAGAVTSGSYLRGNGTNVVMSTIQAADVPTLNQNTTGTASNVTGTVAIANGGTGQTTATAAFNALNPMTTTGDIIYEASPTTAARLGIGSTGQVLTVAGGIPSWATPTASNITTLGLYENSATISANYTIGTGNNAMSAGPITINTGVTVTVPTGSTWTVV